MSYEKKYKLSRCLSEEHLINSLANMITDMKKHLAHILFYESQLRWVMTRDTFSWIVRNCDGRYGFCYDVELSNIGKHRYTIMNIEVDFVDDEYVYQNNMVELTCEEPEHVHIEWSCVDSGLGMKNVSVKEALESMPWFKDLKIKEKKEKKTMPIYVGYGKTVYIENVIFNKPATIVFWSDGTKTVVKKQKGDKKFDPEKGLAMAISKKIMGNKGNFNNIFKEWVKED